MSVSVDNNVKDSGSLELEAEDYVESIMSSQRVTRVATPAQTGRKRHISLPSINEASTKKARNEDGSRIKVKAKRSLYDPAPTPASRNINFTNICSVSDSQPD